MTKYFNAKAFFIGAVVIGLATAATVWSGGGGAAQTLYLSAGAAVFGGGFVSFLVSKVGSK